MIVIITMTIVTVITSQSSLLIITGSELRREAATAVCLSPIAASSINLLGAPWNSKLLSPANSNPGCFRHILGQKL